MWYNTRMNETHYEDPSDLPDNFDPSWDEPVEQEWDDWRDEQYLDDAAAWESAYGPAEDGGYSF